MPEVVKSKQESHLVGFEDKIIADVALPALLRKALQVSQLVYLYSRSNSVVE